MARYTDIDKLIAEYDRVHVGPAGGARKLMVEAPIADVAPRAEVARDIVEFLFRRSESLQHLFKDNPDSAQCFRGRFELENAAIIIANEYGVDLTKEEAEKALAERGKE